MNRLAQWLASKLPSATPSAAEPYLELPYHVITTRCEGGWFAQVVELPGCMTSAESWGKLLPMIKDAMRCWIEYSLEVGLDVPLPNDD